MGPLSRGGKPDKKHREAGNPASGPFYRRIPMLIDLRFSTRKDRNEGYFYFLPGVSFYWHNDNWGFYIYWLMLIFFIGKGDYYKEDE